jgi:uncharacterized protein (UPF0335 family)
MIQQPESSQGLPLPDHQAFIRRVERIEEAEALRWWHEAETPQERDTVLHLYGEALTRWQQRVKSAQQTPEVAATGHRQCAVTTTPSLLHLLKQGLQQWRRTRRIQAALSRMRTIRAGRYQELAYRLQIGGDTE